MAVQATKRVHDRSMHDSEIIDIVYADNFSDIPSDCELGTSDVESDSGSEFDTDKVETDTDAARPGTSTQTTCVPHEEPPGRLSGDMRKHVLEKIVGSEWGKRKYPGTRYICKFCLVPLHKGECF